MGNTAGAGAGARTAEGVALAAAATVFGTLSFVASAKWTELGGASIVAFPCACRKLKLVWDDSEGFAYDAPYSLPRYAV